VASGKVVGGRVELDGELPEGASVTVIARDEDETFEVDPSRRRCCFTQSHNVSEATPFR
jgi:hypothetical protein